MRGNWQARIDSTEMSDTHSRNLEEHRRNLLRARENVTKGQTLVEQQRLLVSSIKAGGGEAPEAERLLAHLEDSLEFLVRHRESLANYVKDLERDESGRGSP